MDCKCLDDRRLLDLRWDLFAALDGVLGIVEVVVGSGVGRRGFWVVTWVGIEVLWGEQLVFLRGEAVAVLEAVWVGYKSRGRNRYAWMVVVDMLGFQRLE